MVKQYSAEFKLEAAKMVVDHHYLGQLQAITGKVAVFASVIANSVKHIFSVLLNQFTAKALFILGSLQPLSECVHDRLVWVYNGLRTYCVPPTTNDTPALLCILPFQLQRDLLPFISMAKKADTFFNRSLPLFNCFTWASSS